MDETQAIELARSYRRAGGKRKAVEEPGGRLVLDSWQADTGDALTFWNEKVRPLDAEGRAAFLRALFDIPV